MSEKTDEQLSLEISSREKLVEGLLGKKDKAGALKASLIDPPVLAKSEKVKIQNAKVIEKVLVAAPEHEINALVDSLDDDACDLLMRYVYKFMSRSRNCSFMLKLHAKLVSRVGMGAIVRTMTDRKTV
jgi:hypothetical protein